jgi:hypothetical protein
MIRILLISILIFCGISVFGQKNIKCDSIKINGNYFDTIFQRKYSSIKSDTILAIRFLSHIYYQNIEYGILFWKINGQNHFYQIKQKNWKRIITKKLNSKLKKILIDYFDNKIYLTNDSAKCDTTLKNHIDGEGWEYLVVNCKINNTCWSFRTLICDFSVNCLNNDLESRQKWIRELFLIIRKRKWL